MWKNLCRRFLSLALITLFSISTSAPSLACRACGAPAPTDQSERVEAEDTRSDDSKSEAEQSDQEREAEFESPEGKPPR